MKIIKIRSEVKSKIKSFGQAFLKACGVSGQSPDNSRSELKAFKRSNGVNFQPKAEKRGKPAREVFPFNSLEINVFTIFQDTLKLLFN